MTAILLALLAAVAWGTSDTLGGWAARGRHVLAVMALARGASFVAIALVVLLADAPGIGDDWPYAVAAGLVLFAAIVLLYRALAIGPMSVVAPIFAAGAVIPVVWGFVEGESPGGVTVAGLVVAVVGCVVTARAPGRPGMRPDPRGVACALGAAVAIGVGLTLMDRAAREDALSAVMIERGTELVVAAVLVAVMWRRLSPGLRRPGIVPLIGIIDVAAQTLYAVATRTGLLPVVSVLASLYPVVTVLLARVFLHERLSRVQSLGAVLTLAGVAVVAGTG